MLLLALFFAIDDVADAMARYRQQTAAEPSCARAGSDADVAVCARREGSRFRVPPSPPEPGTRAAAGVPGERAALIGRVAPCHEPQGMLVGCGSVGVGVSTSFGAGRTPPARFTPPPGSD